MNLAALFVCVAIGMLFTRRTGPLAGAGVLALVLPLTIWVSGAPFAVAIIGVFVYRILALLRRCRSPSRRCRPCGSWPKASKSPQGRRLNPRCAPGAARSRFPAPIGSACSGGSWHQDTDRRRLTTSR